MIVRVIAYALVGSACTAPAADPAWSTVFSDLDRVALSAWSNRADAVYIVGGGMGAPGLAALALHWDGKQWNELAPGTERTLWWVTGASHERTDVWMTGEAGTVLRFDGSRFSSIASPVQATLFGAWASSPDDVWIVGGVPDGGRIADNDVVLHWDGERLVRDTTFPARGVALLKIWGSGPDDLWTVGESGSLWHRTATGWQDYSLSSSTLFSIHGCGRDDIYAVGGSQILHFDGTAWSKVGPELYASAIGVACSKDGVLVTGSGGLKLRNDRRTGAWIDEQLVEPWNTDFHAAWVDDAGGEWAVGGNYNQTTEQDARVGVVAYFGNQPPHNGDAR